LLYYLKEAKIPRKNEPGYIEWVKSPKKRKKNTKTGKWEYWYTIKKCSKFPAK